MPERDAPVPHTMTSSAVRDDWSRVVDQVHQKKTQILVEKNGVPVAAIIAAEDFGRLSRQAAAWDEPFQVLDRMREAFRGLPNEEIEREVSKTVKLARAKLRKERERTVRPA